MATKKHYGRRRNADPDDIPDDILLSPAPLLMPQATPPPFSYAMMPPAQGVRARPSRVSRAARAVRYKAGTMANAVGHAIRPEAATITKEHLLGVGANAAGGIATAIAANELVDNVGVMPMAIGATFVGGLGSAFLKGNWQRVAQGMLGAGVGQLGTAYLTERALKKAAAAQKAVASITPANPSAPAVSGGKRNAALPDVTDEYLVRAMERSERRLDDMLIDNDHDSRNAYGDSGVDGEEVYGWAV